MNTCWDINMNCDFKMPYDSRPYPEIRTQMNATSLRDIEE